MNKKVWLIGIIGSISLLIMLLGAVLWLPANAQLGVTNQSGDDDWTTEVGWLYNANCAVCHGVRGQGSNIAPPLDNVALGEVDAAFLYDTIAMGRAGTAMPMWSKELGGSLSAAQIEQLVSFIQAGNWGEAVLAEEGNWLNQMLFGESGLFCEQNMAQYGGTMNHGQGMLGNGWNNNSSNDLSNGSNSNSNYDSNSNSGSGWGTGRMGGGMGRMGGGMGRRR